MDPKMPNSNTRTCLERVVRSFIRVGLEFPRDLSGFYAMHPNVFALLKSSSSCILIDSALTQRPRSKNSAPKASKLAQGDTQFDAVFIAQNQIKTCPKIADTGIHAGLEFA